MLAELESSYDFDLETDRLREYGEEAVDVLADIVDLDAVYDETQDMLAEESEYDLDPDWPEDEWLDAGLEYEITGGYNEETAA